MEVQFTPDVQARLDQLAVETGRPREEFISDALAGYFEELTQLGTLMDTRYTDLKSGRVRLLSGEQVKAHFDAKSAARLP